MKKSKPIIKIIILSLFILLYSIFIIGGSCIALKNFISIYGTNPDSIIAQQNLKFYVIQCLRSFLILSIIIFPIFNLNFDLKNKNKTKIILFICLLLINILIIIFLNYFNIKFAIIVSVVSIIVNLFIIHFKSIIKTIKNIFAYIKNEFQKRF